MGPRRQQATRRRGGRLSPEGEAELVRLGSPRRLKTIFRVNTRATRAAERWRRQQADAESRPFLMYYAILDSRTRPSHRAMNGQVFRHDDPVWSSHYPPNGWNCRCRVRALTARQVKARGIEVRSGAGHLERVQQVAGRDKRTGKPVMLPGTRYSWLGPGGRHTLTPDPGWSYNPGRQPFGPPPGGDPTQLPNIVAGQKPWSAYGGLARVLPRDPPRAPIPAAATPAEARSRIREAIVKDGGLVYPDGLVRVRAPAGIQGGDVIITDDFLSHIAGKTDHREQLARYILPSFADPAEVWLQAQQTASGPAYRRVFAASFKGLDTTAVAQEDPKRGLLSWTFYPASEINERRAGYLLYRRPE